MPTAEETQDAASNGTVSRSAGDTNMCAIERQNRRDYYADALAKARADLLEWGQTNVDPRRTHPKKAVPQRLKLGSLSLARLPATG